MTATISKWGNSQGLRFPKNIMHALHLHIGDKVNIFTKDNQVIIEPIKKETVKVDLNLLISQIPNDYQASEEFNTYAGKEEW